MMPPKWGDNAFKQCRVAPRCILCIHKSKSKVLLANSSPSHSRLFSNTWFGQTLTTECQRHCYLRCRAARWARCEYNNICEQGHPKYNVSKYT